MVGTLSVSVSYRTKMTISPTAPGKDTGMMLKSDHFIKDLSPKQIVWQNKNKTWVYSDGVECEQVDL